MAVSQILIHYGRLLLISGPVLASYMVVILTKLNIYHRTSSSMELMWLMWWVWHSLQWRHNERDGVWNHPCLDCLLNHLSRHKSKKTSKLRFTGLCDGNQPMAGGFPSQRASNAENVSIWWCHQVSLTPFVIVGHQLVFYHCYFTINVVVIIAYCIPCWICLVDTARAVESPKESPK